MKKLSLYEIFLFGKEMAPLAAVRHDQLLKNSWYDLWVALIRLDQMCSDGTPLLTSSLRAANALRTAIAQVVPRELTNFRVQDDQTLGWQASTISTGMQQLESVLQNDMPDIAAYVVSQKGIFRTDDLIAHAERQLSTEVRSLLPQSAEFEIQQAGKCLAYELPMACAFHLWRAVETVMSSLYEQLSGSTFQKDKITRNWAAYIQALKKAGADAKITTFLDHIRDEYRNPQTHPDERIDVDESLRLFSVAISSIDQMLRAMSSLPHSNQPAALTGQSASALLSSVVADEPI